MILLSLVSVGLSTNTVYAQSDTFALKGGDRVVFYGDSITDQRMYTILTEEYITTRFPQRDIRFFHSGWGGDRVSGGGGGPIDLRLDRDITPHKPTVVTVMLGMNDGGYRAYEEPIFQAFATGYKHLVDKIKQDNPGVRFTFIQPSPYDDVTRPANFNGGYNAVLIRFGTFLTELAHTDGATIADLNTPVVAMLTKANTANAEVAKKIIPDRVHPGWGGHLIMAESLLKSWNAPALVSSVAIDAKAAKAETQNAMVKDIKTGADGTLSWTATEGALPFPILPPDPRNVDSYNLALTSSDFVDTLDREMLTVSNLTAANYTLKIDDKEIGSFTREQIAMGVNLSTLPTPMLDQADQVAKMIRQHSQINNSGWREIQVPLSNDKAVQPATMNTMLKTLDEIRDQLSREQHEVAKPRPHLFTLVPKTT